MHGIGWATALIILGVLSGDIATAQTSLDQVDPGPENASAQSDRPQSQPGKIDRVTVFIKRHRLLERLTSDDGFYPSLGGLPTGSGFSAGIGYREHFLDQHALFRASAVFSTRGYRVVETQQWLEGLGPFGGFTGVTLASQHFPQEDFYGIGPHSADQARTNYRVDTNSISGIAGAKPFRWLKAGARLTYTSSAVGPGTDSKVPTIELLFDDSRAPALVQQPNYLSTSVFATFDTRDVPGNAHRGSYARIEHSLNHDREFHRYGFDRTDLEVAHFIPVVEKTQVFAFHGYLAVSDARPGNVVPFYLSPTVGGSNSVRGFNEYRFRDRNALFMNFEYRWQVRPLFDIAPFVDTGKVSQDIGFDHLKTAIGIGFRLHTDEHVVFRVDVARGRGQTHYFVKFGPSF